MNLSKKSKNKISKLQNALINIETMDDIFFLGDAKYMNIKEYLQKKKDFSVFIHNINESITYFENYLKPILSGINYLNIMKNLVIDYEKNSVDSIQHQNNLKTKYNGLCRQLLDLQAYSQYNNIRFFLDSDKEINIIYSGYDIVSYNKVSIDPNNQIANVYTNMTWKNNILQKNNEIICRLIDGKLYDSDNNEIQYNGNPMEYIEDRLYLKNIDRLDNNEFNNYINNFYENVFIPADETLASLNTIKRTLTLHMENSSKIIKDLKYDQTNLIAKQIDMITINDIVCDKYNDHL